MRRLLSAVLASIVLAATAAGTTAFASDTPPAVAGVTVLEGHQTAVTPVRLERETVLLDPAYHPGRGFTVTGSSAFVGFALVSDQPQPDLVLVGGRLPWETVGESRPTSVLMPLRGLDPSDRYVLPAGNYRLYLLTDGQPSRVTLTFEDMAGETLLQGGQPVPYQIRMPGPRDDTPDDNTYYVSGDHADLESNGLIFSSRFARYSSYAADRDEGCLYDRATTRSTDFGPNCPGGGTGIAFVGATLTKLAEESTLFSYGGVSGLGAGTYGVGVNTETAGVVAEHRLFVLWLSYEQRPAPPPARSIDQFCDARGDDDPFTDIDGNTFASAIRCGAFLGIAHGGPAGLSPDRYGPRLSTSRAQMASFVVRLTDRANALDSGDSIEELPPYDGTPAFTDVAPDDPHFEAINRLEQAGIVAGGPEGRLPSEYGATAPVSRAQMATFLNRAIGFMTGAPLTAERDYFTDDAGSAHEDNINAVASAGIAVGDGAHSFSPGHQIPRDQIAEFVVRGLALLHETGAVRPAEPLVSGA